MKIMPQRKQEIVLGIGMIIIGVILLTYNIIKMMN